MNKSLDLKNPQTFNEKLQWLKIYNRDPQYTKMVDKYEVRKYIQDILGKEYSVPLLGVYNSFDEINFNALPDRFVLKPNHTSGDIFICNDKSQIDHLQLRKEINKWLKRNYYWLHREWPYKNIKPKILCEEYIESENPKGLIDYKFMCFHGKVKCLFVCLNRNTELNVDFYDLDWNLMPFKRHYSNSGEKLDKPQYFNNMVEIATILSKNLPFVRVDLYEANNKLYFGELTFYPGSGFEEFDPESYDYLLGSWIKLHENEDN